MWSEVSIYFRPYSVQWLSALRRSEADWIFIWILFQHLKTNYCIFFKISSLLGFCWSHQLSPASLNLFRGSSVDIRERSRSPRCPNPARLRNVLFLLLYVCGLHDHDNSCMRKTVIEHRLSCVELVWVSRELQDRSTLPHLRWHTASSAASGCSQPKADVHVSLHLLLLSSDLTG